VSLSLPGNLVRLIDEVRELRHDPTRSDTVRILLLTALGSMNYLRASERKALGMKLREVKEIGKD
jgi:metal-responsive CopG/Arc/MetJ family transcriptional regulator